MSGHSLCGRGWPHLAIQCLRAWPRTERRSPRSPLPQTQASLPGLEEGDSFLLTWSRWGPHLPGAHSTQSLRDGTSEPDVQLEHHVSAWEQCSHQRGSHGSVTMTRPPLTKAEAGSGQVGPGRRVRPQEQGQCHLRAGKGRATWQKVSQIPTRNFLMNDFVHRLLS